MVKTFTDVHKCLQIRNVKKCTTIFLSQKVEECIKPNPKIPLSALKEQLQQKHELDLSKMKVFRAKQMATERFVRDMQTSIIF